jgi:hypothetical protein
MLSTGVLRHFNRACSAYLIARVESAFLLTKVFHTGGAQKKTAVFLLIIVFHI